MHREITLKERALDGKRAIEIIEMGSYGVLSTVSKEGVPYGVPLHYSYWNKCICFHCAQQGHKLENIDFRNKVSFCVVTKLDVLANKFDTDYESAIAFGSAIEVTDNSEKKDILTSILNKYSANHIEAGEKYMKKYWDETKVIKIEIDHLTGKTRV